MTDKTRYVISDARAIRIEKRSRQIYVSGIGKDAIFHTQDLGWWLLITGSHEAIFLGEEQPDIQEGDKIRITLERVV